MNFEVEKTYADKIIDLINGYNYKPKNINNSYLVDGLVVLPKKRKDEEDCDEQGI